MLKNIHAKILLDKRFILEQGEQVYSRHFIFMRCSFRWTDVDQNQICFTILVLASSSKIYHIVWARCFLCRDRWADRISFIANIRRN